MTQGGVIVIGLVTGLAGSAPGLLLSRAARNGRCPTVAMGLGVTVSSFCLLSLAVGMGFRMLGAQGFLGFSVAVVAGFLGAWITEAALAWRWMNRRG